MKNLFLLILLFLTSASFAQKTFIKYIYLLDNSSVPNIITSFTNSDSYPYETFSSSDVSITSAINTTGIGGCITNTFDVTVGDQFEITYTFTLNSGSAFGSYNYLTEGLTGASNRRSNTLTLQEGTHTGIFISEYTGTVVLQITTTDPVNFSLTNVYMRKTN